MITNEDCMDLMERYEDNYFDLAIVDPPYGILSKMGDRLDKYGTKHKKWDNAIPNNDYFIELQRVSKNQIIWGGNYFPYLWKNGCKGFIFWYKHQPVKNWASGELAWTSFDKPARCFDYMFYGNINAEKQRFHPTQKPVKLYEWLLMNYATCKTCKNQGGYYEDVAGDGGSQMWQVCDDCDTHERPVRILDTHLGSGSIAIACHNLGFELTGCELDKDYYEAAMKRINEHKQQIRMF